MKKISKEKLQGVQIITPIGSTGELTSLIIWINNWAEASNKVIFQTKFIIRDYAKIIKLEINYNWTWLL